MPHFRELTVRVTDALGEPLQEYGVQHRDRSALTWCHIESKTDMAFRISVTPDVGLNEVDGENQSNVVPQEKHHLIAELRLDGRKKVEKAMLVYLDRSHREHWRDVYVMKSRAYRDEDGTTKECGWVFRDVGIEDLFENLSVVSEGEAPLLAEDELVNAFNESLRGEGLDDVEEKSLVGRIEVTIRRVTLGETVNEWKPEKLDQDAGSVVSARSKISHEVGREALRRKKHTKHTIYFTTLDDDSKPVAVFRFYYRSAEIIHKMFSKEPCTNEALESTRKRRKALDDVAARPLRIAKPVNIPTTEKHGGRFATIDSVSRTLAELDVREGGEEMEDGKKAKVFSEFR